MDDVSEARVGSEHQEQVGKARHHGAEVGPAGCLASARAACGHRARGRGAANGISVLEAGAEDDGVDLVLHAVARDDALWAHLANAVGDHLHVGAA